MAVNNKDFKVKHGLIVEGTTGTINGYDILTKNPADDQHIIDLIGGEATPLNTPDTVVKRDGDGDFAAGTITADLVGDVTGTVSDISNHDTDDLTEGTNNLYFQEHRAQTAVSNALGSGLGYGSEGAGNVFYVDTNVIATKTFATDEANAAQAAAEQTAANDATTKANNAQAAAEQTAAADATTKANTAEQNAKDYADAKINDASTATDKAWSAYKTSTEISLAQEAAEDYADNAIAALVDSAPETLNTLNELAAALQDNPDIIADLQDIAAGKQDTLTAGANIDITGATISVTGLDTADVAEDASRLYFTDTRAKDAVSAALGDGIEYVNGAFDVQVGGGIEIGGGTGNEVVIDRLTVDTWYDANGAAADALQDAKDYADALDTDDIAEGSNLYYTDIRAKGAAADLLVNATKTNITITGNEDGLTITAEDGIAGKTTDDLGEGEDNLYFTDQRAIDALQNTTPTFSAVDINSIAKQVAGTTVVPVAGVATAYSWAKADYRSAEFLVKIAQGGHTQVSKVLLTLQDNDNISITEYGVVGTNGDLGEVTAAISGNDVQLKVDTVNNTSTVTVVGTLLV